MSYEDQEHRYIERGALEIMQMLPEDDGRARRMLRHAERLRFAAVAPPTRRILRLVAIATAILGAWLAPGPFEMAWLLGR